MLECLAWVAYYAALVFGVVLIIGIAIDATFSDFDPMGM